MSTIENTPSGAHDFTAGLEQTGAGLPMRTPEVVAEMKDREAATFPGERIPEQDLPMAAELMRKRQLEYSRLHDDTGVDEADEAAIERWKSWDKEQEVKRKLAQVDEKRKNMLMRDAGEESRRNGGMTFIDPDHQLPPNAE